MERVYGHALQLDEVDYGYDPHALLFGCILDARNVVATLMQGAIGLRAV